jgi:Type ISP C-terminal specificity domain
MRQLARKARRRRLSPILSCGAPPLTPALSRKRERGRAPSPACGKRCHTEHYRLANRSVLEWILDQHKEKTPKDPTIREKFNTYRFADNKEKVVDLLMRVTRVSVETMAIVVAMKAEPR